MLPSSALCRPYGTRVINLILPGTAVPGYRLCRPYGTRVVSLILPGTAVPGYRLCRPYGTRVVSLILPGTAVPGYRLCRPYGTRVVSLILPGTAVPGYSSRGKPVISSAGCALFRPHSASSAGLASLQRRKYVLGTALSQLAFFLGCAA
jgi:hypothetical protein